jgi:hypothetical protein
MASRPFPFLALLPATALVATYALIGCGGSGFDGDVEVPDGYATYRGDGVSFVHPEGWSASTKSLGHDITELRFRDPDASGPSPAAISLTVQPGVGERFDSQLEGERTVLESAGGAEVSHEDADVPGAAKAVRSTIESDGAKSEAVDVLLPGGRHLALAAGGPAGELGALDPAAVIASLRVEE